jgi:hypothetical protein
MTASSFDALIGALAAFQDNRPDAWMAKALAPSRRPNPLPAALEKLERLRRRQQADSSMQKALSPVRPTREQMHEQVRAGVNDVLAKALAMQRSGEIGAVDVARLESHAHRILQVAS